MQPGESRVFSLRDDTLVNPGRVTFRSLDLYPGYRTYGGQLYTSIGASGAEISAPKDADFKVALTFDARTNMNGRTGSAPILDFGYIRDGATDYREQFLPPHQPPIHASSTPRWRRASWPPIAADDLPVLQALRCARQPEKQPLYHRRDRLPHRQ